MDSEAITTAETKRDRVRRLFINPMIEHGWRKPGNVKQDAHDAMLVKLADGLAYLTDHSFGRLRECMNTKGTGPRMNNWPTFATIMTFAQVAQPRPIDELPNLLSWFRSAAGAQAELEGRLVEEYDFWCKHMVPPWKPIHAKMIADAAVDNRRRIDLIKDRLGRGVVLDRGDREWMERYHARLAHVRGLLEGTA